MLEKYISYFPYDRLASFSIILTLLPLILIAKRRAYIDPSLRLLMGFLLFKFIMDLFMFHYAAFRINNLVFANALVVARYCLLSSMFYFKFESRSFKRYIFPSVLLFIAFTLWDIFHTNPSIIDLHQHRVVMYAMTVEALLMIFWTLLYFFEVIRSLKIPSLLTFPFFWICSGLLLYYSTLIFIAPTFYYFFRWNKLLDIGFLDRIPYIFEIVSVILFSIGISFFSPHRYAGQ